MSSFDQKLTGISKGKHYYFGKHFEVDNFLIEQAVFSINEELDIGDPIICKTITEIRKDKSGVILDSGTKDGMARMLFCLFPEDIDKLIPYIDYAYDINMTTDLGDYLVLEMGTLSVIEEF